MDQNEHGIIDDLFDRLRRAEAQSQPRDPEAEALIARHIAQQPAAPYYMAQAMVVQQEALARAQSRVQELEHQFADRGSGGFLGGLFGGQEAPSPAARAAADRDPAGFGPYRRAAAGGGFLAGAMQTALGVASGFLIADAISGLLSPDDAAGAAADADPHEAAATAEDPSAHEDPGLSEEAGGDSDFGGFDEL
jgi:uncharacterized protein